MKMIKSPEYQDLTGKGVCALILLLSFAALLAGSVKLMRNSEYTILAIMTNITGLHGYVTQCPNKIISLIIDHNEILSITNNQTVYLEAGCERAALYKDPDNAGGMIMLLFACFFGVCGIIMLLFFIKAFYTRAKRNIRP